jgi:hypothetical protein
MKYIVTLIALVASTVGFSQIGENDGATRDDHTTGIEKIDVRGSIFTKVTGGQLIISSSNSTVKLDQVRVHDINGRVMDFKTLSNSNSAINVSTYSTGIYILAIETSQGAVARKIFISNK